MNKQDYVNRVSEARQKVAEYQSTENLNWLAITLGSLGNYIAGKENDYLEAIKLHEEAKSIYTSIGDNDGKARACFNLCITYELGLHNNIMAYSYIKQALEFVQDGRSRAYYELEFDCLKTTGYKEGWLPNGRINRTQNETEPA